MPSGQHAILGASSASRWLACPGSIREIGRLPRFAREKTSIYALEGTAAHFLSEHCLAHDSDPEVERGRWLSADGIFDDTLERPDLPGEWFRVDDEMIESVQLYLDVVRGHMKRLGNAELRVERMVYPVRGREDMFGTADAIIIEPYGELIVGDFKYGKGVVVDVDYNDQAMFYGLGALHEVEQRGEEISKVTLEIIQPRAPHDDGPVRGWTLEVDELREYEAVLRAGAAATEDPEAPLVPGKHCRFCPAASACEALRSRVATEMIATLPDDLDEKPTVRLPDPSNPEELARAMEIAEIADFWAAEVKKLTQRAIEGGIGVKGWKLVRKRSQRRWSDEHVVEQKLRNKRGVKVDDIFNKKLQSPAQMEKNPKIGKAWVAEHAVKPEGGLSIARESDPRPALPAVADQFPEIEDSLE